MTDAAVKSDFCYNCGEALSGPFCAACGQQARARNPTLHDLLHDFIHETLHVDGKIFRSVRQLLLAPGFLTREYFDGRRARWIAPIRLYLIFSVAYFAIASLVEGGGGFTAKARVTPEQETQTELQRLGFESEAEMQSAIARAQHTWIPRIMFLLVPMFAGLVYLFVRRGRENYPQHLYFALHVHAAWFAAGILDAATYAESVPRSVAIGLRLIVVAYAIAYTVVALRTAYDIPLKRAITRGALVLGIYFFAIVTTSVAIALSAIFSTR